MSTIRFLKNLEFLTRFVTLYYARKYCSMNLSGIVFISILPRPLILGGNSSFLVSDSVRFRPASEIQLFL